MKIKFFMNCFDFMGKAIENKLPNFKFTYYFTKSNNKFKFIKDYFEVKQLLNEGHLDSFKVIHINNWFNFLLIKYKKPHQIWIAESHGIHMGLNDKIAISQSRGVKKLIGNLLFRIFSRLIIKSIKKFDIYLVAIPNALRYAKMIRSDAAWLPNPINDYFFEKIKPTPLDGSPAVFFPTRFHPVKNPLFGIKIFERILRKYPKAKLHLIKYGKNLSQEDKYVKQLSRLSKNIVYHNLLKKEELAAMYRSADLVLGAFNQNEYYANLNLIELEAMACGAAVIAHDKYEFIKKDLDELPDMALKLIEDSKFKSRYIEQSKKYVRKIHSAEKIAKKYEQIIKTHCSF